MSISRTVVSDGAVFEDNDDVTLEGDVGKNACVVVNGNLIIHGDVGEGAVIVVTTQPARYLNAANKKDCLAFSFNENSNMVSVSQLKRKRLIITGQVLENVLIMTDAADIQVKGAIGQHSALRANMGSISVADVGSNVNITANFGGINIKVLGSKSEVCCNHGHAFIADMGQDSKATINLGNLTVNKNHASAMASVSFGRILGNACFQPNRVDSTLVTSSITFYGSQTKKQALLTKESALDVQKSCCQIL